MNKKINGFIASAMLLSCFLSFASQRSFSAEDKVRYGTIVSLYNKNKGVFIKDHIDPKDIRLVESHKDGLRVELEKEKVKIANLYAPGMLNVAGKSLAAVAFAGGLVSAAGVLGAPGILGKQQNKGLGYLELLKARYGGVKFGVYRWDTTMDFFYNLSDTERSLVGFGFFAPLTITGSLVFAAIAKYLLNKSASYMNSIKELEAEIKLDEDIISAINKALFPQVPKVNPMNK